MKLWTNRGFSLIQVMVGLSVAAGVGLLLMRQQDTASRMQSKANINQSVNTISESILRAVSNRAICSTSLVGLKVGDKVPALVDATINPEFPHNSTDEFLLKTPPVSLYFPDQEFAGDIEISDMQIVEQEDLVTGTMKEYFKVEFDTDPRGVKKQFGGKTIAKTFLLQGVKNLDGEYQSCYSEQTDILDTSIKKACEEIGGTWDEEADPKCKLTNLPRCVMTDQECRGLYSESEENWEMIIKNPGPIRCVQHYDKNFGCFGQGSFTRTCYCEPGSCPCNTGSVGCYERERMDCEYEIVKSVNRCCQKEDAATPGPLPIDGGAGGSGGSNGGGVGGWVEPIEAPRQPVVDPERQTL